MPPAYQRTLLKEVSLNKVLETFQTVDELRSEFGIDHVKFEPGVKLLQKRILSLPRCIGSDCLVLIFNYIFHSVYKNKYINSLLGKY